MTTNALRKTAGAMTLAFAAWLAPVSMQAQPMYDRIHVNLPYTVTMQNKTLQPGDYTIQQLPSQGDSRVLLFYSKDGMKFETSAMTIPALDPNTARDTKLVLNHVGDDYYISKIWVQGKDYGYELPVPASLKSRQNERMTEASVKGTYEPSSSTDVTTSANNTAQTTTPDNANSNNPADTTNRPMPNTTANTTTTTTETAQNNQPVTQPATTTTPDNNSADRAMADQSAASTPAPNANENSSANRETMPATAAGWLTMLLSGGALSGAGLMLRRKRS